MCGGGEDMGSMTFKQWGFLFLVFATVLKLGKVGLLEFGTILNLYGLAQTCLKLFYDHYNFQLIASFDSNGSTGWCVIFENPGVIWPITFKIGTDQQTLKT